MKNEIKEEESEEGLEMSSELVETYIETYDLENNENNHENSEESSSIGEKPYKCEYCNKPFKTKYYVKTHQLKCGGKDYSEIANEINGVVVDQYGTFDELLQAYKCNHCDKIFKSKYLVKYHYTYVHEKPHKCEKCEKTFGQKSQLEDHVLRVHEGIIQLDCEKCDETFTRQSQLLSHIKKVHEEKKKKDPSDSPVIKKRKKKYKCEVCGETFGAITKLKKHNVDKHGIELKNKCHLCDKLFTCGPSVRKHIAHYHEGIEIQAVNISFLNRFL